MLSRIICHLFGHDAYTDCVNDNAEHPWVERRLVEQLATNYETKVGVLTGRDLVRVRTCRRCKREIPKDGGV